MKLPDAISRLTDPLKRGAEIIAGIGDKAGLSGIARETFNRQLAALFMAVVYADGEASGAELRRVREFLTHYFGEETQAELRNPEAVDVDAACAALGQLAPEDREEILAGLLDVAYADQGYGEAEAELLKRVAAAFKLPREVLPRLVAAAEEERLAREKMVRSGAGLLVALVVIGIFILTATFLKSVLFGLVLAYFFLPVQRWYFERFFPSACGRLLTRLTAAVTEPFRRVIAAVSGAFSKPLPASPKSQATVSREDRARRVAQACHATLATLIVVALALALGLGLFSVSYAGELHRTIRQWLAPAATETVAEAPAAEVAVETPPPAAAATAAAEPDTAVAADSDSPALLSGPRRLWRQFAGRIERFRPTIEGLPGFAWARETTANFLGDEANRGKLLSLVLRKSGVFFAATTSFFGRTAALLLDLMLTLFFFSFFLQKIAEFDASGSQRKTTGQYLVESIFRSRWLPEVSTAAMHEAQTIIDTIIGMLRTWVRGYLWIIIIETGIYFVVFMILGLPYFPLLAMVAGLTILLPFIGPILSCLLTITVVYAVGSPTVALTLVIVLIYFVMNGIVEQLFIYPALVGEALGLSTLETIIVVLVGGLFAGLPGVVFAVPAASIVKYLIPKIYGVWPAQPQSSAG